MGWATASVSMINWFADLWQRQCQNENVHTSANSMNKNGDGVTELCLHRFYYGFGVRNCVMAEFDEMCTTRFVVSHSSSLVLSKSTNMTTVQLVHAFVGEAVRGVNHTVRFWYCKHFMWYTFLSFWVLSYRTPVVTLNQSHLNYAAASDDTRITLWMSTAIYPLIQNPLLKGPSMISGPRWSSPTHSTMWDSSNLYVRLWPSLRHPYLHNNLGYLVFYTAIFTTHARRLNDEPPVRRTIRAILANAATYANAVRLTK